MLEIVKIKKDVAWILEQIKCLFAKGTYATAWSANHTLLTGGPYLKDTIVWYQGFIYKAKHNNESELPTNIIYWECIGEGFLLEEKIPDWWALPGTKTFIKNKPTKTSDFLNDGEIAETPDPYASQQYVLERIQQIGGVTKTSELLNDGEDGTHPFITLEDLPFFPDLSGFVPYIGATSNLDLREFQLLAGQITFDQSPTQPAGVRVLRWNETDGTLDLGLKGGNVTLQLGQETVVRVVNKTATALTEAGYQVVYISGAQGQRLKVDLALATSDLTSAGTIGLVTEDISVNQEGFITSNGLVRGLNTTGSLQGEVWQDGDMLYLSPTIAGRVTNIKPEAPYHTVVIGVCVHAHANQGSIFVKVDNGYELEELHNVLITEAANNDLLVYEASTTLWKNKSLATVLGYIPANNSNVVHIAGYESITGVKSFDDYTIMNGSIILSQSAADTTAPGHTSIFGIPEGISLYDGSSIVRNINLKMTNISALRTFEFPNASGTLSLTSDLSSYQPLLTNPIAGIGFVKVEGSTVSYDNSTYALDNNVIHKIGDELVAGVKSFIGSGIIAYTPFSNTLTNFVSDVNDFQTVYAQNLNNGSDASADFVAYNDASDVNSYFIDMGMNSSNFSSASYPIFPVNSGYLFTGGGTGIIPSPLYLGTSTPNSDIVLFAGGVELSNIVGYIKENTRNFLFGQDTDDGINRLQVAGGIKSTGDITIIGSVYANGDVGSNPHQLVTKEYVDNASSAGLHIHPPVRVERHTNLPSTYLDGGTTPIITAIASNSILTSVGHSLLENEVIVFSSSSNGIIAGESYFVFEVLSPDTFTISTTLNGPATTTLVNGTGLSINSRANSGVGATLTNAGVQAALEISTILLSVGNRILIQNQTNAYENGIYTVTDVGSPSTNWVLTRSTDANKYGSSNPLYLGGGDYFFINEGTPGAGESYVLTTIGEIIFGSTPLTFTKFNASPTYTGNNPISVTGQIISLTGTVDAAHGGTGINIIDTGDILYGSNTNTWLKLSLGAAYKSLVVNASGTQLEWNAVALNQSTAVSGQLGINNGGTGASNAVDALSALGGQPLSNNLSSLSELIYAAPSFIKMTAIGTFTLDSTSYLSTVGISDISASGTPDSTTYLRGDGTWSTIAGGGGSTPGGVSGEIQYNDGAGGFAGAANVEVSSGNLKLVSTADPATPTGGLIHYSKVIAGRVLPKIIGPSGIDTIMQVGLHGNSVFMVGPSNTTTAPTTWGGVLTTATTISHQQTIASANPWQATRRTRFQTSTTAGNATGARTAYVQWYRGSVTGFGGFWFRAQLGININLQGGQKFVGLCASTAALAGDPSALLNMCGMGYDAADLSTGNWFFMYNDGTGTATKVDLGVNAIRSTTAGYDLVMYMAPGGSELFVRIVNLATNIIVLETSYTTLLPVANTGMAFTAQVRNGAVAAADNIEIAKVYIETDY